MLFGFLSIDYDTKEFVLLAGGITQRFPATVIGALHVRQACNLLPQGTVYLSSDFNHPDEFPEIPEDAIDVAAGYGIGDRA